jgi:hypothetical protein
VIIMLPPPHLLLAALAISSAPAAADVYKCTDTEGNVAYQDHLCPASANATQMNLPDPAPATASVETPPAAAAQPAAKTPAEPAMPPVPLPALWICENAEDGSRYISENGTPPVRYVPLGTLGYPGKSLAQAYGPGGGSGISAPGVNKIPISTSPRDAPATQYTALQDACAPASREQTCAYLRKQYDDVEHKLKRAFKDERAVLEPRASELESQLQGC